MRRFCAIPQWVIQMKREGKSLHRPVGQSGEAHLPALPGEGQTAGEEHGLRLFVPGAVLVITHQGEAPGGELNPDLVAAAGVKPDAHQAFFTGGKPQEF